MWRSFFSRLGFGILFLPTVGQAAGAPLLAAEAMDCLRHYPEIHAMQTGLGPPETPAQRESQAMRLLAQRLGLMPERVEQLLKPSAQQLLEAKTSSKVDRARAKFALGRYDEARLLALEAGDEAHRAAERKPMDVVAALQLAAFAAMESGAFEEVVRYITVASGEVPPERDLALWSQLQAVTARAYEGLKMPLDQEQMHRHILREYERRRGEGHADTVRVRSELAGLLYQHGKDEEAERQSRQVLQQTLRLHGHHAVPTQVAKKNLARVLEGMGRPAEAESLRREVFQQMMADGSGASDSEVIAAHTLWVKNLMAQGRQVEAEPEARKLVDLAVKAVGADALPALEARLLHARLLVQLPPSIAAASQLESLLRDGQRVLGPEHRLCLTSSLLLGQILNPLGRHEQARDLLEKTLAIQRRTLPTDDLETLETRHQLGVALLGLGQHQEALAEIRIALVAFTRLLKDTDPRRIACSQSAQKLASLEEGKTLLIEEQRALFRQVCQSFPESDPARLNAHVSLASYIETTGRYEEALREYETLMANCLRLFGPEAESTCTVADKMALCELSAARMDAAIQRLEKILVIRSKRYPNATAALEEVRFHLGYALGRNRQYEEAVRCMSRSYEACKNLPNANPGYLEWMRRTLAEFQQKQKQPTATSLGGVIAPTPSTALPEVGTLNQVPRF